MSSTRHVHFQQGFKSCYGECVFQLHFVNLILLCMYVTCVSLFLYSGAQLILLKGCLTARGISF